MAGGRLDLDRSIESRTLVAFSYVPHRDGHRTTPDPKPTPTPTWHLLSHAPHTPHTPHGISTDGASTQQAERSPACPTLGRRRGHGGGLLQDKSKHHLRRGHGGIGEPAGWCGGFRSDDPSAAQHHPSPPLPSFLHCRCMETATIGTSISPSQDRRRCLSHRAIAIVEVRGDWVGEGTLGLVSGRQQHPPPSTFCLIEKVGARRRGQPRHQQSAVSSQPDGRASSWSWARRG